MNLIFFFSQTEFVQFFLKGIAITSLSAMIYD